MTFGAKGGLENIFPQQHLRNAVYNVTPTYKGYIMAGKPFITKCTWLHAEAISIMPSAFKKNLKAITCFLLAS